MDTYNNPSFTDSALEFSNGSGKSHVTTFKDNETNEVRNGFPSACRIDVDSATERSGGDSNELNADACERYEKKAENEKSSKLVGIRELVSI